MEQRPQGKAGLIPARAFEHERLFLRELTPHLPAPYLLLERDVDEYGYVAVEANYYWVPGTERGQARVLRYESHLQIYRSGQLLVEYPLAPDGVKNRPFHPPGQPAPRHQPHNRKASSLDEEKRLRAMAPEVGAYIDFLLETPGLQRHRCLRRLLAVARRMSPELFLRSVRRAHRYRIVCLDTLQRIARLYLAEGLGELFSAPAIDESFRERPAYREGALTDLPDLSQYESFSHDLDPE